MRKALPRDHIAQAVDGFGASVKVREAHNSMSDESASQSSSANNANGTSQTQLFPHLVCSVDGCFEHNPESKACPVSQREAQGSGLGHHRTGNLRLFRIEVRDFWDWSGHSSPCVFGTNSYSHQLAIRLGDIYRAHRGILQ